MDQVIYTAADGNYVVQSLVLARSLVETQLRSTRLIVFGNGWSKRDKFDLMSISAGRVSVEVRTVDEEKLANVKLTNGFPLATAYNILAPQYLLDEPGRCLYVDADVVVTDDLSELWTNRMDHVVGAVLDAHIGWMGSPSMWRPWREEAIEPLTPYLNTGVMLIDMDRWRRADITNRILEVLERYPLPCVDQDAINIVLRGAFDRLAPRYNVMPYHYLSTWRYVDALESDSEIELALRRPAILHFHRSLLGKPWEMGSVHPRRSDWRRIASDVRPMWRRRVSASSLLRQWGARYAKMLTIDDRATRTD